MSNKVWIDHISTTTSNIFKIDFYNFFNKYVLNIVKPSNEEVEIKNEKAFEFYEKGKKNIIFFEINYLKKSYKLIGMEMVQRGHYDQGLSFMSKAIELDPKNEIFRMSKGNLLKSLERSNEAIKCYDETIEICPNSADAYFGKGHILIEKYRFKDALNCFNKSIEMNPAKEEYHYSKGNTLKLLEKYNDAIKSLDEALKINPSFAAAYQAKGEVLMEKECFEESLILLSKACDIEPRTSSLTSKGNCLVSMRRFQEALQCFDLVLKIDPHDMLAIAFKTKCQSEINRIAKKKLLRK
jgi:tetratricopeptide (TPR) repeat protein